MNASRLRLAAFSAFTLSAAIASATPIAYDSFLTTANGAGGTYVLGDLAGQTATVGTTGYAPGGWSSFPSGVVAATTTPLTHPFMVNPISADDGSIAGLSTGGASRSFASFPLPAASTYYFSALLRKSSSPSQTSYVGVGGGAGENGFAVGFYNGGLAFFYDMASQ